MALFIAFGILSVVLLVLTWRAVSRKYWEMGFALAFFSGVCILASLTSSVKTTTSQVDYPTTRVVNPSSIVIYYKDRSIERIYGESDVLYHKPLTYQTYERMEQTILGKKRFYKFVVWNY